MMLQLAKSPVKALLNRSLPWLQKGLLAIIDQGLISGSNFLVNVLLARWLLAEQYGAYAVAISIFFLAAGFHQNLVLSPLSVLGPTTYRDCSRHYLGAVLWIQAAFSVIVGAALMASALIARWLFHYEYIATALEGLAIAAPLILLFWLARCAQYLELSPGPATQSALLYSFCLIGGVALLKHYQLLSLRSVFVLMGLGSLAVSYSLFRRLKPAIRASRRTIGIRSVWAEHWKYGRWEVSTGLIYWACENISLIFTGAILGIVEVGSMRALMNLTLPAGQVVVAVGRLAQPHVSRVSSEEGVGGVSRSVRKIAMLLCAGGASYFLILTIFHSPVFYILYNGKYMQYSRLVPIIALGLVFQATYQAFCVGLRALRSPSSLFVAYSASTAVSFLFGIILTRAFGLAGMTVTSAASAGAALAAAVFLFRRKVTEWQRLSDGFDPAAPESFGQECPARN